MLNIFYTGPFTMSSNPVAVNPGDMNENDTAAAPTDSKIDHAASIRYWNDVPATPTAC